MNCGVCNEVSSVEDLWDTFKLRESYGEKTKRRMETQSLARGEAEQLGNSMIECKLSHHKKYS